LEQLLATQVDTASNAEPPPSGAQVSGLPPSVCRHCTTAVQSVSAPHAFHTSQQLAARHASQALLPMPSGPQTAVSGPESSLVPLPACPPTEPSEFEPPVPVPPVPPALVPPLFPPPLAEVPPELEPPVFEDPLSLLLHAEAIAKETSADASASVDNLMLHLGQRA
jgi:hypothetical protein